MKLKSKKSALLLSFTSLLLCFAMLAGSTFAWFTDTATTGVNTIQAGTLDIDLQMKGTDGNWVTAEGKTLQFKKSATAPADEKVLWEPGCTYKLPELRIVNNSNLALKYKVLISGIKGDAKLNEAIDWTIQLDGVNLTIGEEMHWLPTDGKEKTFTISGHMKENAGNEYQKLTIDGIAITVVATQYTYEHDSNNDQYDKDAGYPVLVSSTEDLTKALKNATPGSVVMLTDNVNTEETLTVNKSMTLDLGANAVTNNANKDGVVISGDKKDVVITATTGGIQQNNQHCIKVIAKNSDITVDGGTYSVTGTTNAYFMEGSPSESNNVTIQNVTYNGERGVQFSSGNNNNITIKDSTFKTTGYSTIFIGGNNNVCTLENVTVNGAKIFAADTLHNGSDGYSVINIKSGTYDCQLNTSTGCTISITGGTFKNTGLTLDKFKTYVADGYAVTVNTDGSWTVAAN